MISIRYLSGILCSIRLATHPSWVYLLIGLLLEKVSSFSRFLSLHTDLAHGRGGESIQCVAMAYGRESPSRHLIMLCMNSDLFPPGWCSVNPNLRWVLKKNWAYMNELDLTASWDGQKMEYQLYPQRLMDVGFPTLLRRVVIPHIAPWSCTCEQCSMRKNELGKLGHISRIMYVIWKLCL